MLSEENELIQDCVSPVRMVVSTGAYCIVVGDFLLQQSLVQSNIARIEEVVSATIDGDGQSRLDLVDLAQCGAVVPAILILFLLTQMVLYIPVVGECSEVDTAAQAAACTKNILMAECQPECAMSTHAETCDGSCVRAADGLVILVHVFNQLLAYISLELILGVVVTVEIPRLFSVGTNKDNAILIGQLGQFGLSLVNPLCVVVTVSVKKIHHRHGIRIVVLLRGYNDVFYVAIHGIAMYFHCVNALCAEIE